VSVGQFVDPSDVCNCWFTSLRGGSIDFYQLLLVAVCTNV
jgi:hypothetical protein